MKNRKMIAMIQADIDRYKDILGESRRKGKDFTSKVYADLMGKYSHIEGFPKVQDASVWLQAYPNTYLENIIKILGFLKTYVLQNEEAEETYNTYSNNTDSNYKKVFIVHGHNGELKHAVARLIEKQNIDAVILSEQANQGRTIIEKIEEYSDVGAAICLFTSDDEGKAKNESNLRFRARQNVVFEAGFFYGLLGRNRVVILADGDIELPSDLSGVVYTNTKNWEFELLKELKSFGYTIDTNKLLT